MATFQPPPEKRSRRAHDRWQLPRQRLAEAGSIGTLFSLLLQTLLDCMRLPELPEDEEASGRPSGTLLPFCLSPVLVPIGSLMK